MLTEPSRSTEGCQGAVPSVDRCLLWIGNVAAFFSL